TLASGSIAVFNLANNLSSILVNAVSVSLSTAIFPTMTLAYLKEDKKDFKLKFSTALRQIIFLAVPLSFLIFLLRAQIVRVILGWGKFSWLDTRLTAACLGIFALSLFAQGIIFIASKAFYAAHNTRIPAVISLVAVAFNISVAVIFVNLLNLRGAFYIFMQNLLSLEGIGNISIVGLVLAYSITAVFQVFLLLFFLYQKYKAFSLKEIYESVLKVLTASLIMAVLVFLTRQWLVAYNIVRLETFLGVFLQLAFSGFTGAASYILISYFLGSKELKIIAVSFFNNKPR
ncbi:MAG: lipid II flippase MurJ, partial [Patescibacteria group bacterium]